MSNWPLKSWTHIPLIIDRRNGRPASGKRPSCSRAYTQAFRSVHDLGAKSTVQRKSGHAKTQAKTQKSGAARLGFKGNRQKGAVVLSVSRKAWTGADK